MHLELLVSDGEYLSVKFICEALGEMHEERKKRIENGRKGGRPKTKQNLPSNEQNQNQKDNKSFESLRPPKGGVRNLRNLFRMRKKKLSIRSIEKILS